MSFSDLCQRPLVSCLSTFSKDSSFETTWSVSIKIYMQPPGKGAKKGVFSTSNLTMIIVIPIKGKKINFFFSLESLG